LNSRVTAQNKWKGGRTGILPVSIIFDCSPGNDPGSNSEYTSMA
jgi:hypothetical protein